MTVVDTNPLVRYAHGHTNVAKVVQSPSCVVIS